MYNAALHAVQVGAGTMLSVSISETDELGNTYHLASTTSSSHLLASADEDPLWIFLQQVRDCLSIAMGDDQRLYRRSIEHDRIDGGWGGAGQTERPERSEDQCSVRP